MINTERLLLRLPTADDLGFEETGRASRTIETHIGWCDSAYFRIDRTAMLALGRHQN